MIGRRAGRCGWGARLGLLRGAVWAEWRTDAQVTWTNGRERRGVGWPTKGCVGDDRRGAALGASSAVQPGDGHRGWKSPRIRGGGAVLRCAATRRGPWPGRRSSDARTRPGRAGARLRRMEQQLDQVAERGRAPDRPCPEWILSTLGRFVWLLAIDREVSRREAGRCARALASAFDALRGWGGAAPEVACINGRERRGVGWPTRGCPARRG